MDEFRVVTVFEDVQVEVYADGRIKSITHNRLRSNGTKGNHRGRFLKPAKDKNGYLKITVSKQGKRKTISIHRLVAMAFIPNPEDKPTVNHINGIQSDNRVENLEWATHKEQKEHSIKTGLCQRNIDALNKANERRSKSILFRGAIYKSIREASRLTGVVREKIKEEGELI